MNSSTERLALMDAILSDPSDDVPRLAYADWLEENGNEFDRYQAEFIRVQIELHHLGNVATTNPTGARPVDISYPLDYRASQLQRREKELMALKDETGRVLWSRWLGPVKINYCEPLFSGRPGRITHRSTVRGSISRGRFGGGSCPLWSGRSRTSCPTG